MEAIMIAGVAAVAVGGCYAIQDFMSDLGLQLKKTRTKTRKTTECCSCIIAAQRRIKKVSGMHI